MLTSAIQEKISAWNTEREQIKRKIEEIAEKRRKNRHGSWCEIEPDNVVDPEVRDLRLRDLELHAQIDAASLELFRLRMRQEGAAYRLKEQSAQAARRAILGREAGRV